MAIETADDRAVFVDPDDFGALVTKWNGTATAIAVLFDRPVRTAPIDGASIEATEAFPSALAPSSTLPAGAARGDEIEITVADEDDEDDTIYRYKVRDLRPDGTGMTRVDLEEAP